MGLFIFLVNILSEFQASLLWLTGMILTYRLLDQYVNRPNAPVEADRDELDALDARVEDAQDIAAATQSVVADIQRDFASLKDEVAKMQVARALGGRS